MRSLKYVNIKLLISRLCVLQETHEEKVYEDIQMQILFTTDTRLFCCKRLLFYCNAHFVKDGMGNIFLRGINGLI